MTRPDSPDSHDDTDTDTDADATVDTDLDVDAIWRTVACARTLDTLALQAIDANGDPVLFSTQVGGCRAETDEEGKCVTARVDAEGKEYMVRIRMLHSRPVATATVERRGGDAEWALVGATLDRYDPSGEGWDDLAESL